MVLVPIGFARTLRLHVKHADGGSDLGMFAGCAMIRYSNLGSALYAKEKLNGFEYPPGNRLVVYFLDDGEDRSRWAHSHSSTAQRWGWRRNCDRWVNRATSSGRPQHCKHETSLEGHFRHATDQL